MPLGMVGFPWLAALGQCQSPFRVELTSSSRDRERPAFRALPSSMMSAANGRFLADAARIRRLGLTLFRAVGVRGAAWSGA